MVTSPGCLLASAGERQRLVVVVKRGVWRRGFSCLALLLSLTILAPAAAQEACTAPKPVCAARAAVFAVSSFDPLASAVLLEPGLLVTNRHVVADETRVEVHGRGGGRLVGEVVPTTYPGDLVLIRVPGLEGTHLHLCEP